MSGYVRFSVSETISNNNNKLLRDGVLKDDTGIIPITISGSNIDEIKDENTCYQFSNVGLKHYFAQKLTTLPNTVVEDLFYVKVLNEPNYSQNCVVLVLLAVMCTYILCAQIKSVTIELSLFLEK